LRRITLRDATEAIGPPFSEAETVIHRDAALMATVAVVLSPKHRQAANRVRTVRLEARTARLRYVTFQFLMAKNVTQPHILMVKANICCTARRRPVASLWGSNLAPLYLKYSRKAPWRKLRGQFRF
jgi:hypothetical protein